MIKSPEQEDVESENRDLTKELLLDVKDFQIYMNPRLLAETAVSLS